MNNSPLELDLQDVKLIYCEHAKQITPRIYRCDFRYHCNQQMLYGSLNYCRKYAQSSKPNLGDSK